jgi:hypothetical protein
MARYLQHSLDFHWGSSNSEIEPGISVALKLHQYFTPDSVRVCELQRNARDIGVIFVHRVVLKCGLIRQKERVFGNQTHFICEFSLACFSQQCKHFEDSVHQRAIAHQRRESNDQSVKILGRNLPDFRDTMAAVDQEDDQLVRGAWIEGMVNDFTAHAGDTTSHNLVNDRHLARSLDAKLTTCLLSNGIHANREGATFVKSLIHKVLDN